MPDTPFLRCSVAIVGGGFSGAAVAVHLLREAPPGLDLVMVEPSGQPGQGLAYGTPSDSHCLNVPAGRLGLDPRQENGFIDWLQARGLPFQAPDFVPRRWLAAYVASELAAAAADAATRGVGWRLLRTTVRALTRHRPPYRLHLDDGTVLGADQVVLAPGHLPAARPPVGDGVGWDDPRLCANPWHLADLGTVDTAHDVLLLGSGLTAIDVATHLMDQGHRGRIHLLSRRGLLPQPHRVHEARPEPGLSPVDELGEELRLAPTLAAVRGWARDAQAAGGDWRDVMASLRPCTARLWQRLSVRDRRQFLRHVQPHWDTHRHRVAAPVHARVAQARADGRLTLQAGRVRRLDALADGTLRVDWQARGGAPGAPLRVGRVVNCTGPTSQLRHATDPLHASLRQAGVLCADALGLGVLVDDRLRPLDACGVAAEGLHYIGPLLKAQHWEAVAVPELRVHARQVAAAVLAAGAAVSAPV